MTKSLLDTNVDSVEDIREHPHGKYLGKIIQVEYKEIGDEKELVSISFRADTAIDLDLTGVELNRRLYHEVWITPNSIKMAKKGLKEAGVPMDTGTFRSALSSIEGSDAEFTVGVDAYNKGKGNLRPKVLSFRLI